MTYEELHSTLLEVHERIVGCCENLLHNRSTGDALAELTVCRADLRFVLNQLSAKEEVHAS